MQMTMLLLMVGTALVFAGRAHVQLRSGVPPRSWLVMEALLASGPGFGWGCATFGPSTAFWLAVGWLSISLVCYVVGRIVANKYSDQMERKDLTSSLHEEENQMSQALSMFNAVDRSIDFELLAEAQEQTARDRRKRLASTG